MRMIEPDAENNLSRGRELPWNWRTAARWAAILLVYLLTFGALGLALAYIFLPR